VDVERRAALQHVVGGFERGGERFDVREGAVARRMHVGEVEHRPDPAEPPGDLEHVVEAADLADAAHHLDAEGHGAALALKPFSQLGELLADRPDRGRARAAEQEAGMEDDRLGAGGLGDPGRVVEHPDRHALLLVALDVAHEAGDRRVDGEGDLRLARSLAELGGPVVVHPEAALEVDLTGGEAALSEERDRRRGGLARGHAGRA